ncbi:MAG: hypothetical protein Fur0037_04940 [Planctomycetota bacterium]
MTVAKARRCAALRGYLLRRHRLPVAGGLLSIIAPDLRSRPLIQQATRRAAIGEEPPYWAQIWPASVGLARWLCRRDLGGIRVLDLGCGIGVAAAAAARSRASVLACDVDESAVQFSAFNLAANDMGPGSSARRHNWHEEAPGESFDLLLLADVTYRPRHHRAIQRHVESCLAKGGVALHVDPYRRESDGFLAASRRGFAIRESAESAFVGGERVPLRFCLIASDEADISRWEVRRREVRE